MQPYTFLTALAALQCTTTVVGAIGTIFETRITTLVIPTTTRNSQPLHHSQARSISGIHHIDKITEGGGAALTLIPRHALNDAVPPPAAGPSVTVAPFQCSSPCWLLFQTIQKCYRTPFLASNLYSPAPIEEFRRCFCGAGTRYFEKLVVAEDGILNTCKTCITDTSGPDSGSLSDLTRNISGFCLSQKPSLFLFIYRVMEWLVGVRAPDDYPIIGSSARIKDDITKLVDAFTLEPGMNELPASSSRCSNSGSSISSVSVSMSSAPAFPTSWLTQLPSNWPYTQGGAYGMARRPGQVTTFQMTDPSNGQVSAIVEAILQWYPRPLGRQNPLEILFPASLTTTTSSFPGLSAPVSTISATSLSPPPPFTTLTLTTPDSAQIPALSGILPGISIPSSTGVPAAPTTTSSLMGEHTLPSMRSLMSLRTID